MLSDYGPVRQPLKTKMWVTNELLAAIPTGTPVKASTSAHSVAADRILNHVFVPLPPLVGDAHCANGCIGVYWSEDEDEE